MNKKQKIIAAIIAIVILVGIGVFWKFNSEAVKGDKEITIHVVTETQNKSFELHTDALTLSDVLKEASELQVIMEEGGTYGDFVTSMLGEAQEQTGPWWVYSSENNLDCKNADGFCPAVNQVNVQDEDIFEFKLTSDIY